MNRNTVPVTPTSYSLFLIIHLLFLFSSCSVTKQISRQAYQLLIHDTSNGNGHIGISIYEPGNEKYWYEYQADKYFIPASNTKIFTLYAGMKYLGDSLAGMRISTQGDSVFLIPTGDPTFLHPAFPRQPVYDFLSACKKNLFLVTSPYYFEPFGKGWAWDDYNESYMTERSPLPIFGNMAVFSGTNDSLLFYPKAAIHFSGFDSNNITRGYLNKVTRDFNENNFHLHYLGDKKERIKIPFISSEELTMKLLTDTIHKPVSRPLNYDHSELIKRSSILFSQPSDSLLKPMMFYSDNFFAEQTLLMAATEHLGYMADEKIIDSLLRSDLKDIPQKPRWVDGSGLSRYNLFTPRSFIYILNRMKNEFGMDRLKSLFPTGGQGSLKKYYTSDSLYIYAKTGSMSNVATLSGFLITKKGKLLIFSILANNCMTEITSVRRKVECFLEEIRKKF